MIDLLRSKVHSLCRRGDSLPNELEQWLSHAESGKTFEKNFSQLQALEIFMSQVCRRLEQAKAELIRLTQDTPRDTAGYTLSLLQQAGNLEVDILRAHRIWDYFRSKLEQRFVPQFGQTLLVSDLIAYDCYQAVRVTAEGLGIPHRLGLRDYPLTFLLDEGSPVTWSRRVEFELDRRQLPLPIIGVPWDHAVNPWELLSLHHEVAHDIDADLNQPAGELAVCLEREFSKKGSRGARREVWLSWIDEIFADFLGILLAGPPFVSFLAGFMTWPPPRVCSLAPGDPHPTPYLRTLLNGEFVRRLALGDGADRYVDDLLSQWETVYGNPPHDLQPYIGDFGEIISVFRSTGLQALKSQDGALHSLAEIAPFGRSDYENQAEACRCLLSNRELPPSVPIRQLIGAAYMAIEQKALDEGFARGVVDAMSKAIVAKAPKGQLALRTERSRQLLIDLADSYVSGFPRAS